MATKKHSDMAMDKPMMQKAVNKHEANMHPGKPMTKLAKGGMVARGLGAARKSSGKFVKNG
jgi:hypothetical protein